MFTMHREFERADNAGPYPKSLLYFVHHAFEDPDETPILGLEENLTADEAVMKLFASQPNEIVFSVTPDGARSRASSHAIHHGDFDNDGPTMNSVCRRVLAADDNMAIVGLPEGRSRGFDPLEVLNMELTSAASPVATANAGPAAGRDVGVGFGLANARATSAAAGAPHAVVAPAGGTRTALCIGIDAYPAPNTLQGCVNDSQAWEQLFASMHCQIATLRDAQATRAAITASLAEHVSRLRAGDLFLFQYAGHGTQFPDDSGDEPDNNDEALCPFDMMTAGFIRDDDVRLILNQVPAGALAIGFIDCCHSGTIARMMRAMPDATTHSLMRAIKATPAMIAVHRRTRTAGRAVVPAIRRDITFAACRDDQVAFETNGHGDYTTAAVPILGSRTQGLTNLQVQKLLQDAFGAGARQNPMLDCDPRARKAVCFCSRDGWWKLMSRRCAPPPSSRAGCEPLDQLVQERLPFVERLHLDALVAPVKSDVVAIVEDPLHAVGRNAGGAQIQAVGRAHHHHRHRRHAGPQRVRDRADRASSRRRALATAVRLRRARDHRRRSPARPRSPASASSSRSRRVSSGSTRQFTLAAASCGSAFFA